MSQGIAHAAEGEGNSAEVIRHLCEWNLDRYIPNFEEQRVTMDAFMSLRKRRNYNRLKTLVPIIGPAVILRKRLCELHSQGQPEPDEAKVFAYLGEWGMAKYIPKFRQECIDMEEFKSLQLPGNRDHLDELVKYSSANASLLLARLATLSE